MPDSYSVNSQILVEIFKYLATFIVGGIVFLIREKYSNRKAIFTKKVSSQRLAFSFQSNDWGNLQILYNDQTSNNLHILSAEIINSSSKDFPMLTFEFSVPTSCTIYRHQGQLYYDDLFKELTLQKEYNDLFEKVKIEHQNKIQTQQSIDIKLQNKINYVTRHRSFAIPLIKAKSKAVFNFLVEDIENNPYLNISILEPGIKVTTFQDEEERLEIKRKWTEYGGFIIFLILSYPIYKFSDSVSMAIWFMIINLTLAPFVSLSIYFFFVWVKKIL